jgi:phosphoglycerate kinase
MTRRGYRTLDDLDVAGKRVLVRVDFNVPIRDGRITDATRIERSLPTLRELVERGARVVLLSHFGRPKGARREDMSLRPLVAPLSEMLGQTVAFAEDCIGGAAERVVAALKPGEVALLENLRFHAGEEKNAPDFVAALAALGDVYVNDAFSAAHRAHASTEGLAHRLPAAVGRAMQAELEALEAALTRPERPVVAVVGGAKVSTKLELLGNLVGRVDALVIGGGMANTFLAALGKPVGRSLCEHDLGETARDILRKAEAAKCAVVLPRDVVAASALAPGVAARTLPVDEVPEDMMILDIGSATIAAIAAEFERARTLVWNGPFGAFETPPFDNGTNILARHAALLTRSGRLRSVAGGGDTVAALEQAGVAADFSYVSTAGGAFLEWLEGKELPGVKALQAA